MNILDKQRKKQIFDGFVQKGCNSSYNNKNTETEKIEEKSPAEKEREKELNKK